MSESQGEHDRASGRVAPVLYRVEEAAEALRISRTVAYDLIRSGQLRTVKIGGRRRVPVAAVHEFVDSLEVSPPTTPS